MKKPELIDIIRSIVKEEVNNALPQLLMEVLAEKIGNQSVMQEEKPMKSARQSVSPMQKSKPIQEQRVFSSNPAFNAVLNETVGGVPQEAEAVSAIDTIRNLPKEVLSENKAVAAVATAMTRDYSKLIKAVDAKVKNNRP